MLVAVWLAQVSLVATGANAVDHEANPRLHRGRWDPGSHSSAAGRELAREVLVSGIDRAFNHPG